jgi:hypothetical protein
MIDLFAIAVTHGLLALAAWRLVLRDDLDRDPGTEEEPKPRRGMERGRPAP